MLIYHYHAQTGLYLGCSQAEPDPMEWRLAREAVRASLVDAARADYAAAVNGSDDDEIQESAQQTLTAALAAAEQAASATPPPQWLIPAHSTREPPPAFKFDERARWLEGAWTIESAPLPAEPDPEPEADLAAAARLERDRRIQTVRWLIDRHRDEVALGRTTTLTNEDYRLVLQHVQDLRDLPEQEGFPGTIDWPVLPEELLATGG